MIREKLAAYAHAAWSGWMKYMYEKSSFELDGSMIVPPALVARWRRQMLTPYEHLPENEKQSDLAEADKMLEIVEKT